jgi:cell division septation protein DedD
VRSLEHKGLKTVTNLLSKTAGLIFFSFLAISLGVVFGLLFEGWVKDQPGAPVGSESGSLKPVDLSDELDLNSSQVTEDPILNSTETVIPITPSVTVKYKVRVGPYSNRKDALAASAQLESLGYPVYVGNNPPFAVQVGAFGSQTNAERLKSELTGKGYKVFIDQN